MKPIVTCSAGGRGVQLTLLEGWCEEGFQEEVPLELALLNGGKRKGTQNYHVQKPKGRTGSMLWPEGSKKSVTSQLIHMKTEVGLQREVGATRESEG